jgi:hypothetical protein
MIQVPAVVRDTARVRDNCNEWATRDLCDDADFDRLFTAQRGARKDFLIANQAAD